MSANKCCSVIDTNSHYYIVAICCGLVAGYCNVPILNSAADVVSSIFINLLKLVSLPIIFLSIVSTASGMESLQEIKHLGKKVIKYTLLTTIIAATVALGMYVLVDPVRASGALAQQISAEHAHQGSYWNYLLQAIPSNIVQPFAENNVIGVLFLALGLSLAILTLPNNNRTVLHGFFSSLYAAIMKITTVLVSFMPIAVWAFVTLFFDDMRQGLEIQSLALYLVCIIAANLIQGFVVLPLMLKLKGIPPVWLARKMLPALSVAFFTKSSAAALPMAIKCASERAKISSKVSNFSLPLCTTINMNGCAAFILITVLFVSMSHGMQYSYLEMATWVIVATIAAVGNAGVPMGCFFLASAFLAAMNVPLNIMGVILPFYTLIDMLETAINVWSDSCVTAVVEKEVSSALLEEIPQTQVKEEHVHSSLIA
jgi:Na+/H+-dicarboxylate symporter